LPGKLRFPEKTQRGYDPWGKHVDKGGFKGEKIRIWGRGLKKRTGKKRVGGGGTVTKPLVSK